jgi:hypothetical protein
MDEPATAASYCFIIMGGDWLLLDVDQLFTSYAQPFALKIK